MDINTIENQLNKLIETINQETFIFDLLRIYDFPKSTITRIKNGDANLLKNNEGILVKNKFLYQTSLERDPHDLIDELSVDEKIQKYRPRFLIVTDFKIFLAIDTKTRDSLDIEINSLPDHYDFLFPWIGKEKNKITNESVADIRAANKMGELYDLIIQNNPDYLTDDVKKHALNLFFARILFCFFAEDTELFSDNLFSNTYAINSNEDGSDSRQILSLIFQSMDQKDKSKFPAYCKNFPYIGGELFSENTEIPLISRNARSMIIESGKLDWYQINPDIFGSMIQVIASPEDRSAFGAHYTSVSNILKVINPLFMEPLNKQFENCKSENDFEKLLKRIYSLRIFDPASGSGNFLIVSYKELARLEFRVFSELQKINPSKWSIVSIGLSLTQFYGITINDFDSIIAKLSLYISEHQMIMELNDVFGNSKSTLPFDSKVNILKANSLLVDWKDFCDKDNGEIYIVGNPPYSGWKEQTNSQKSDMDESISHIKNYRKLDYISCWFILASNYIKKSKVKFCFVTTPSVSQGEQVSILWPYIFNNNQQISFCYKDFPWKNNAANQANINVVIICVKNSNDNSKKFIFNENQQIEVKNISPYLIEGPNDNFVIPLKKQISNLPLMETGSQIADGGNLLLSSDERKMLLENFPETAEIIKQYMGGEDLIKGHRRWCLWITDSKAESYNHIDFIKKRINACKQFREGSKKTATKLMAKKPYRFFGITYKEKPGLLVPITSSSKRKYIPVDFVDQNVVPSSTSQIIYDSPPYLLTIFSSKMMMVWINVVGSKSAGGSIKFSSTFVYNTFCIPDLDSNQIEKMNELAFNLIDARESFPSYSLDDLYRPGKEPRIIIEAHEMIDTFIDKIYGINNNNDNLRLSKLMELYKEKNA